MSKISLVMVAVVTSCLWAYADAGAAPSTGDGKDDAPPIFHISDRSEEPLLRADKPWEDYCIAGGTVIREDKRWRMWYGAYDHSYKRDDDAYLCYAESPDGLHWTKPNLGFVEYGGNKDNNILLAGPQCGGFAFSYVFVDEGKPTSEKYKMIWQRFHEGEQAWQVYGATSTDGMHWSLIPEPLSPKNSDTSTICIPDGGKYRLYTRIWRGGWSGVRTVGYTESDHFGGFPDPIEIFSHDDKDPEGMQFYSNAATKLGDHFYVIFPAAFYTMNQTVRSHLAWSRDGVHFTRYGREPVIDLGKKFDKRGVYVGAGAVPGDAPNTWWFYYLGTNTEHDAPPELTGSQNGIGRFLLAVEEMPK